MRTVIINHNLLGDALMCTPGIVEYKKQTDSEVVLIVGPESYNDILLDSLCADKVIKANDEQINKLKVKYAEVKGKLGQVGNDMACLMNINDAFELSRHKAYFFRNQEGVLCKAGPQLSEALAKQLNVTITDTHYSVLLNDTDFSNADAELSQYKKPVLLCAALSSSCSSRKSATELSGKKPNKMLDNKVWQVVVDHYKKDFDFVFVGGKNELGLDVFGVKWAKGLPIRTVGAMCKKSAAVVSIDTGIMHIAQAVDANLVSVCGAVLSDSTSCHATKGKYYCVDHSECSSGPYGISSIEPEEIISGIEGVLK